MSGRQYEGSWRVKCLLLAGAHTSVFNYITRMPKSGNATELMIVSFSLCFDFEETPVVSNIKYLTAKVYVHVRDVKERLTKLPQW